MRPPPVAKARNIREAMSHEIGADMVASFALIGSGVERRIARIITASRCVATRIQRTRFRGCADFSGVRYAVAGRLSLLVDQPEDAELHDENIFWNSR